MQVRGVRVARGDEHVPFDFGDNRRHNEKRCARLLYPAITENSCRGAVLQVPTCRQCFGRVALERHAFGYIDRHVAVLSREPPYSSMRQHLEHGAGVRGRGIDHRPSDAVPASADERGTGAIPEGMAAIGDTIDPHALWRLGRDAVVQAPEQLLDAPGTNFGEGHLERCTPLEHGVGRVQKGAGIVLGVPDVLRGGEDAR